MVSPSLKPLPLHDITSLFTDNYNYIIYLDKCFIPNETSATYGWFKVQFLSKNAHPFFLFNIQSCICLSQLTQILRHSEVSQESKSIYDV